MEPRTSADIISDLLHWVVESEWSGRTNIACHCHPEEVSCCPSCGEEPYDRGTGQIAGEGWIYKHKSDCQLSKIISEARAFLEVENELLAEQGYDKYYSIP